MPAQDRVGRDDREPDQVAMAQRCPRTAKRRRSHRSNGFRAAQVRTTDPVLFDQIGHSRVPLVGHRPANVIMKSRSAVIYPRWRSYTSVNLVLETLG